MHYKLNLLEAFQKGCSVAINLYLKCTQKPRRHKYEIELSEKFPASKCIIHVENPILPVTFLL